VPVASFRFYAELNDFLPPERRGREFSYSFIDRTSVKDMIESLGVPHTEIDIILVNGESVDFTKLVEDGDRIAVYPMFEAIDVTPLLRLRPEPLRVTRFVADVHLGRLVAYLRMLGFDTVYRNDFSDGDLARISAGERRILLTRDRGLLKRSIITHGYCVRATNPREQAIEVVNRFDLRRRVLPFRRCIRCNGELAPVPKELIVDALPERTIEHYNDFHRCISCGQIYWKGGHYRRMQTLMAKLGFLPESSI
jgi:uncharacterized protein with PIN domain